MRTLLIIVSTLLLSACTYNSTCWTDGKEVYKDKGFIGFKQDQEYAPQPLDKDYWSLPTGEVITGRCETRIR